MSPKPTGFPPEIEELFNHLWQDVVGIHAKWVVYSDLFLDRDNWMVIAQTATFAFQIIGSSMWDDIVASYGRLTDPSCSPGKKENLTLERLVDALEPHAGKLPRWSVSDQVEARRRLANIRALGAPLTMIRHRRVAHRDWQTARGTHPEPIPPLAMAEVNEVHDAIADLMNMIQGRVANAQSAYDRSPARGTEIICYLRLALEANEKEKRRLMRGDDGDAADLG